METEIWKDIPGYENKYQASDNGKIRKLTRLHRYLKKGFRYKEMSIKVDGVGYFRINLSKKGIAKTFRVHRLIALTFIPLVDGKDYINHKDGDKLNNNISNLEWCNQSENIYHSYRVLGKKGPPFRQVLQIDINENIMKKWNSIRDVQLCLGINRSNITKVCRGKMKTAGGFIWKYCEELTLAEVEERLGLDAGSLIIK